MLIFDNKEGVRRSQVMEFEPLTQEIIWEYSLPVQNEFYSETCGSVQRLPNGNTLITESDGGRAFEITEEKEIVWEFVNPNRTGAQNELIATLFEVIRCEPSRYTFLSAEGE